MVAPLLLLLPKLISLASIVPSLMKYAGAGDNTIKIAEQAVGIAQVVTGATTPDAAIEILNTNPEKALEFRTKIQLLEKDWDALYLADIQNARDRDVRLAQAGYRNSRANSMYFLAVAIILLLVYLIWADETLNEYVKGIFTLVLGRFLGYLDGIYNFEFGTTRASKSKDDTISKLTNGGN